MGGVRVDTSEFDALIRKVNSVKSLMSGSVSSPLKAKLDEVGNRILEILAKETPVADSSNPDFHKNSKFYTDSTHLKDSWKWKLEVKGTVLEGFAFVPTKLDDLVDLLESGSPRHPIKAGPGGVLRFYVRRGGGWELAYAKSVDHPGFKANKFIERAAIKAEKHIERLVDAFQIEVNRIIVGK
jgi:hypothetical protein